MLFSIVMPVYNSEPFLEKSIKSVLSQTYDEWELIVINDGSKDKSEEIIRRYSDSDCRIRYFSQENKGVSASRNHGLTHINGEYMLFLDSDDELVPDALQIIYKVIEEERCDIVVYNTYRADLNSNIVGRITEPFSLTQPLKIEGLQQKIDYIYSALSSDKCFGIIGNYAVKTEIVRDIRFCTSMIICEDLIFDIEMYKKAESVVCIPNYLYLYRYNPSGCVNSFNYQKISDIKTAFFAKERLINEYKIEQNRDTIIVWFCQCILSLANNIFHNKKISNEYTSFIKNDDFIMDKFERLQTIKGAKTSVSTLYVLGTPMERAILRIYKCIRKKMKRIIKGKL